MQGGGGGGGGSHIPMIICMNYWLHESSSYHERDEELHWFLKVIAHKNLIAKWWVWLNILGMLNPPLKNPA